MLAALVLWSLGSATARVVSSFHHTRTKHTAVPQNVLWLPLGDSITFGCTGPTIQDCHSDSAGYRIPLALALSQSPLGSPDLVGFNITTMGTDSTGPSYVPSAWTHHCGFPGWTALRCHASRQSVHVNHDELTSKARGNRVDPACTRAAGCP